MKNYAVNFLFAAAVLISINAFSCTNNDTSRNSESTGLQADPDNAGLKLPDGFGALKVAGNIGSARHLTVNKEGDIYVKLNEPKNGSGIILLHENANGKAEVKSAFGDYGGTGIAIKNDYLYASSNEEIFRYKLNDKGEVIDKDHPEKIVTGLLARHEHESKSITLDNDGNIYVNIGAYSNNCQTDDRSRGSMGVKPCPLLDSAGGIWQFKAGKQNQTYGDGVRYATGLRNVVGLDWNTNVNALFVMMHGRDQLHDLFPKFFDEKQSAELPAECLYQLHKGSDCGWPYCYYDELQNKKILAPEYGGNGEMEGCKEAQNPVVAFPGHLAPDGLLFYTGTMFPEKYRNGAFIAFHGSWNRAPEPQKGYFVAFVPFKDGKPSGKWEIFADGFSGLQEVASPRQAAHRPCGLAQGPDGSVYISDDAHGTIYRIIYTSKK